MVHFYCPCFGSSMIVTFDSHRIVQLWVACHFIKLIIGVQHWAPPIHSWYMAWTLLFDIYLLYAHIQIKYEDMVEQQIHNIARKVDKHRWVDHILQWYEHSARIKRK